VHEDETHGDNEEGVRDINVKALESSDTKSLHLVKDGRPYHIDEDIALELLKKKNIYIYVDLGMGDGKATYWTIDYSYDYIKINAEYRS
jgi:glutamate N-acetyltransferase/amino-acid N-acetyltransferase